MLNYYRQPKNIIAGHILWLDRVTTRCSIGLPGMDSVEMTVATRECKQGTTKNETGV